MPFKKGDPRAGRPKGSTNKATKRARDAIASFAERSTDKFLDLLDDIAKEDPQAAVRLYLQLLEYHLPKLARTEVSGEVDQTVTINVQSLIPAAPNTFIDGGTLEEAATPNELEASPPVYIPSVPEKD